MMKRTAVLLLMLQAVGLFAADVAMPRLAMPTAQNGGMGGTHVAYTDNVFALLVNPAAMMRVEQRSFLALSPSVFNPESIFGFANAIGSTASDIESIVSAGDMEAMGKASDILNRLNGKVSLGFDIREFPLSIAWTADGFGFGLWSRVFANANIIGTNLSFDVYGDAMLPVGFAFKILDIDSHSVDAGITVKPFTRVRVYNKLNFLSELGNISSDKGGSGITDRMTVPVIVGAGFDLGLLYRWDAGLSAGLTFDDIVTRGAVASTLFGQDSNSYYVPFSMNVGLAYNFRLSQFWEEAPGFLAKSGFSVAVDWRDMTNLFQQNDYSKRNAVLDLGMGLELSLAEIVKLRFGMNEMLPALGLGFALGPLQIDTAYYGRELGLEPGQLSVAVVDLTLAFRPGAKKRDWAWTRGSLIGLFNRNNAVDDYSYNENDVVDDYETEWLE
jgi:hypothetical protein